MYAKARRCTRGTKRLPAGEPQNETLTGICCWACSVWLFHPFSINISTRGNADSLVVLLVLLTLLLLMRKQLVLAAFAYVPPWRARDDHRL